MLRQIWPDINEFSIRYIHLNEVKLSGWEVRGGLLHDPFGGA